MVQRHRDRVWVLVGLLVSLTCVVIGVQGIHWQEVFQTFAVVKWEWVGAGACLLVVSFLLFARRWRGILLRRAKLPTLVLFGYLCIGYLINAVLPLRAGDVTRAAVLRKRHSMSTGTAVASVVMERLLDLLIVVGLGVCTAFFFELPSVVRASLVVFSCATVVGLFGLAVLAIDVKPIKSFRAWMSGMAPQATQPFIDRYVRPFLDGFRVVHSPVNVLRVFFWSALGWVCFVFAVNCFIRSVSLDLPWTATAVVIVMTSLGAAIPSSPGAIGIYHALAVFALSLFGVPSPVAVAFAMVAHTTAIVVQVGLGAICSMILGVSWWRSGSAETQLADTTKA